MKQIVLTLADTLPVEELHDLAERMKEEIEAVRFQHRLGYDPHEGIFTSIRLQIDGEPLFSYEFEVTD